MPAALGRPGGQFRPSSSSSCTCMSSCRFSGSLYAMFSWKSHRPRPARMQPGVPESHHLSPWTDTVTGSAQPFLQTHWYIQRTGTVYPIERTDCEETFFYTFSIRNK